ncbi:N-acetyltransferase family protein [Allosphingosinicella humi]
MTDITYRAAGAADAGALARLFRDSFVETFGHLYSRENLAAFLAGKSEADWAEELVDSAFAIRIAEELGEAVGYAKLGPPSLPFEPRGPTAELRQLYVLKPWHGAGIAHELMRWTIAEAKARGARDLVLSVYVDNHRARRFYDRYGFEFVGPYSFMVGDHADEDHVMRLKLETCE